MWDAGGVGCEDCEPSREPWRTACHMLKQHRPKPQAVQSPAQAGQCRPCSTLKPVEMILGRAEGAPASVSTFFFSSSLRSTSCVN